MDKTLNHIQVSYNPLIQSIQKFNLVVLGVILKAPNQEFNLVIAIKSINLKFEEILNYFHSKLRNRCFLKVVIVKANQHSLE